MPTSTVNVKACTVLGFVVTCCKNHIAWLVCDEPNHTGGPKSILTQSTNNRLTIHRHPVRHCSVWHEQGVVKSSEELLRAATTVWNASKGWCHVEEWVPVTCRHGHCVHTQCDCATHGAAVAVRWSGYSVPLRDWSGMFCCGSQAAMPIRHLFMDHLPWRQLAVRCWSRHEVLHGKWSYLRRPAAASLQHPTTLQQFSEWWLKMANGKHKRQARDLHMVWKRRKRKTAANRTRASNFQIYSRPFGSWAKIYRSGGCWLRSG